VGLSAALLERMDERSRALSKTRKKRQVTEYSNKSQDRIANKTTQGNSLTNSSL